MESQSRRCRLARLKDIMGKIALILFLFAAGIASAGETNYFCAVCGKGPLHGLIHISKWGPVCDDCLKIKDRCSICGLPIHEGDAHVQTGDGRFICGFDKTNAVLTLDQAMALFAQTRDEVAVPVGTGRRSPRSGTWPS